MGDNIVNANESTSSSLLERATAKDDVAWTRLVELYAPLIYARARLRGLDEEMAGDVVQEVLLKVSKAIGDFKRQHGKGSFRGWLRTITENVIRDIFRRGQTGAIAVGGTTAQIRFSSIEQPESDDSEVLADDDERGLLIKQALKSLEGDFEKHNLQAFYRMVVDGLTSREAAAEFGGTPDGVRRAKVRIIRKLREDLGDLLE